MKLPGNIPINVFKHELMRWLDRDLPEVVVRYWRFSVEDNPANLSVRVVARYKRWELVAAIDPESGLMTDGMMNITRNLRKHFWFLNECADEEEMEAKLLLAQRPDKEKSA